jgi:hypothetical protein
MSYSGRSLKSASAEIEVDSLSKWSAKNAGTASSTFHLICFATGQSVEQKPRLLWLYLFHTCFPGTYKQSAAQRDQRSGSRLGMTGYQKTAKAGSRD